MVGYLNRLRECKVGPSGQITKLSILTNTLKMLGSRLPEDGGSEEDRAFVVRAKIVEAKIQSLQKTLRKESQSLRAQKHNLFSGKRGDCEKVLELIDFHYMLKVHQNIQRVAKSPLPDLILNWNWSEITSSNLDGIVRVTHFLLRNRPVC